MNKDDHPRLVEWPLNEWLSYASWVVGAVYTGWLCYELGAGWLTLVTLPMGAIFGAISWVVTAGVLTVLGKSIQDHAPIWVALAVQALVLPVVLALAVLWFGSGSGDTDGSGRFGGP